MMTLRKGFTLKATAVLAALLLAGCAADSPGTATGGATAGASSASHAGVASVPPVTDTPSTTGAGEASASAEPAATLDVDPSTIPSSYYEALSGQSCANIIGGYLRACTAYVLNATYLARVPFYQGGTSKNVSIAAYARKALEYRYDGQARKLIEDQIAGWPTPNLLGVDPPHISIVSIQLSGENNQTATIKTKETWKIFTTGEHPVFTEDAKQHTITMKKAPDGLHRWVVTAIS